MEAKDCPTYQWISSLPLEIRFRQFGHKRFQAIQSVSILHFEQYQNKCFFFQILCVTPSLILRVTAQIQQFYNRLGSK